MVLLKNVEREDEIYNSKVMKAQKRIEIEYKKMMSDNREEWSIVNSLDTICNEKIC